MNPNHTHEAVKKLPTYSVERLTEAQLVRLENYLSQRGILQETGRPYYMDQYMTQYITLCAGGEKAEGDEWPTIQCEMDEDAQIMHFIISLDEFLRDCKHIVWRSRPMVHSWRDESGKHCSTVRCRLTAYASAPQS